MSSKHVAKINDNVVKWKSPKFRHFTEIDVAENDGANRFRTGSSSNPFSAHAMMQMCNF